MRNSVETTVQSCILCRSQTLARFGARTARWTPNLSLVMMGMQIATEARQIPSNALPGAVGLLESSSRHYGVNEVMVVGCHVDNQSTLRARSCPRIRPQIDEHLRIETRPSRMLLVLLPISIGPTQAVRVDHSCADIRNAP